MKDVTTISLSEETYRKLLDLKLKMKVEKMLGKKRISFDDVVNYLLKMQQEQEGIEDGLQED